MYNNYICIKLLSGGKSLRFCDLTKTFRLSMSIQETGVTQYDGELKLSTMNTVID